MNRTLTMMSGILMFLALITVPVTALAAIDTTPPTTTATPTGTKGGDGWYTTAVTVTLAASDGLGGSGVAKTEYSLDNVTWQTYSAPFVLDKDGDQYIYFRSTDNAGNLESPAKSQEIKINKSGLVGWWKMDGDWKDASIFGNNGAQLNGASFSPNAKVGTYAGSFNASNSYVSVNDNASLELTSAMTLMAWINPTDNANYQQIISKFGYSGGYSYQIGLAPTGKIRTDISKDGTTYDLLISSTAPVSVNTWQHVAATFNNGLLKLYVNGVEVASKTSTVPMLKSGSTPLNIGRSPDNIQYFKGLIDEVLVYNRALSNTEIQEHYRTYAVKSPTVNPVLSPTATPTITISGTKPTNTAIVVNGNTLVPLDGTTSWQTNFTLVQGMNTISVTALDSQNLNSLPATLTVVLDSTAPQVTATSPANNALLKTAPGAVTFALTDAISPLNFNATLNGAKVTNASGSGIPGTWSITGSGATGSVTFMPVAALSDGTYTATIMPTDSLGNGSISTLIFTVDSTPPSAPGIDPITAPINITSKTITGTRSSDSASVVVNCAGATIGPVSYPTATTWMAYVSGLTVGNNTVTAYAVDAAGNLSITAFATITVDTNPPSVGATPGGGVYNSAQVAALSATEPAVIYYTVDGSTPTTSATIYSQPISIPTSVTLKYFARDLAGNDSEIRTESYVIDTTPPVLALSTLSNGAYTSNETLNIAGTVTDNVTVKEISINDTAAQLNADGSLSYALLLKTGANIINIVATDNAGNTAAESRTVTLDQTAPVLAVTTPADNSKTGKMFIEVTGTVDETSVVTVKIKDLIQTAIMNDRAFTATIPLESGYNTIEITAADLAGNRSTMKRTVVFDDQTPSVAVTVPNQDLRTNQRSLTIKGTVSDPLTTVGVTITKDNEIFTPPVTDGSFEQTVTLTEEKTYGIVVTATNEVGTAVSVQRNVIYDITPPVLTIDPVPTPTSRPSQLLSGTREAGIAVTVSCPTATTGEISYPTATTWQVNIYGLREGENVITAASADAAGNAVRTTATVVLATKAPEITLTATPDVIWPPSHQMVPVTIAGGVEAFGSDIKSVSISVRDEYRKFEYNNLTFGSTVMLEAWRNGNDTDGRKYTITVIVTSKGGITTAKTATVTVPHDRSAPR